jgi:hypothetical protein
LVPSGRGRHGFLGQQFVEAAFIRDLMNEATLGKRAKKIGFETGHSFFLTDKAKLKLE